MVFRYVFNKGLPLFVEHLNIWHLIIQQSPKWVRGK
jgi:hypothetical protein